MPFNLQVRKRKTAQLYRVKQRRSGNILDYEWPTASFHNRAYWSYQIWVCVTPPRNTVERVAVTLAGRGRPNEIEAVQIKRHSQYIRLNESVTAIPRLGYDIHPGNMEAGAL